MTERSNRNVYILGAGFSASAGAPVVRRFLDCARQLYDDPTSELDDYEKERFQEVFDFRRKMAQAREKVTIDLDDIEQLFGLVEMSHRLDEKPAPRFSTVYLIAKTLELSTEAGLTRPIVRFAIPTTMSEHFANVPLHRESSAAPNDYVSTDIYTLFAALVSGRLDDPVKRASRDDVVITFNYDIVLDDAIRRVGALPNYELPIGAAGYDGRKTVPVLKLHGSTNWGICAECKDVVVLDEKVTKSPAAFRERRCPKGHQKYQPLLVPPSWDKSEYQEIMRPIWKRAVDELRAATRICIIGYSMPETDAYFKYLMTLALSQNHQLYNMTVVDLVKDKANKVEQRYRRLLDRLFQQRRFSFYGQGFEQFIWQSQLARLGRCDLISQWFGG